MAVSKSSRSRSRIEAMQDPDLVQLKALLEEQLFDHCRNGRPRRERVSHRLHEAIDYALFSPGKRLRPLLVLSCALSLRGQRSSLRAIRQAMPAALAVELIHTYSLIHDDLPAMDDDDLRRGRPSVHRRFDEAVAILAGDALLADAFYLASSSNDNAVLLCRELALTAGPLGLCGGQELDLAHQTGPVSFSQWLAINEAKTAKLFATSALAGALVIGAGKDDQQAMRRFGHLFGMAFQIMDDMDDRSEMAKKAVGDLGLKEMLEGYLGEARGLIADQSKYHPIRELFHFTFASCI